MESTILEIVAGNFASTGTGNFVARDDDGNFHHISKVVMEAKGFDTLDKVKFPFWAKGSVREIKLLGEPNAEGVRLPLLKADGTQDTRNRAEVTRIYDSYTDLVESSAKKLNVKVDILSLVNSKANESGLTKAQLEAITTSSAML